MPIIRLFNLDTATIECFDLNSTPQYIAASHVWSQCLFPSSLREAAQSPGIQALRAVVATLGSDTRHAWLDTLCIDQGSEIDKLGQIPLMRHIYASSECVAVVVAEELRFRQEQVDAIEQAYDAGFDLRGDFPRFEEFWSREVNKRLLVESNELMLALALTKWNTRVWTMQEYVLAPRVVFVGAEKQPIRLPFRTIQRMPYAFRVFEKFVTRLPRDIGARGRLYITTCQSRQTGRSRPDSTMLMSVGADAGAALEVDRVYGLMGTTGVEIDPIPGETLNGAWKRWWTKAIRAGYIRWLAFAPFTILEEAFIEGGRPLPEDGDCAMVPTAFRGHIHSFTTNISCRLAEQASIENGTVGMSGKYVGQCTISARLFVPHRSTFTLKGLGLVIPVLTGGDPTVAKDLAIALRHASNSTSIMETSVEQFAKLLIGNYDRASAMAATGRLSEFVWKTDTEAQARALDEYRGKSPWNYLVRAHTPAYIASLDLPRWERSTKVLLYASNLAVGSRLHLFDFGALLPAGRRILMALGEDVTGTNDAPGTVPDPGRTLHKFGLTELKLDGQSMWDELPIRRFQIGGASCPVCTT